jgi:hypothetical protein
MEGTGFYGVISLEKQPGRSGVDHVPRLGRKLNPEDLASATLNFS